MRQSTALIAVILLAPIPAALVVPGSESLFAWWHPFDGTILGARSPGNDVCVLWTRETSRTRAMPIQVIATTCKVDPGTRIRKAARSVDFVTDDGRFYVLPINLTGAMAFFSAGVLLSTSMLVLGCRGLVQAIRKAPATQQREHEQN